MIFVLILQNLPFRTLYLLNKVYENKTHDQKFYGRKSQICDFFFLYSHVVRLGFVQKYLNILMNSELDYQHIYDLQLIFVLSLFFVQTFDNTYLFSFIKHNKLNQYVTIQAMTFLSHHLQPFFFTNGFSTQPNGSFTQREPIINHVISNSNFDQSSPIPP